jgi:hypothetical protein
VITVGIGQKRLITLAPDLHLTKQAIPKISEMGPVKVGAVEAQFNNHFAQAIYDEARRKIRQAR